MTVDEIVMLLDQLRNANPYEAAVISKRISELIVCIPGMYVCVPAMHASAPPDHKCADCTMDREPCPTCYHAWWTKRHPKVSQFGGFNPVAQDVIAQHVLALRQLLDIWDGYRREIGVPPMGPLRAVSEAMEAVRTALKPGS
jgi:hypothetical protein